MNVGENPSDFEELEIEEGEEGVDGEEEGEEDEEQNGYAHHEVDLEAGDRHPDRPSRTRKSSGVSRTVKYYDFCLVFNNPGTMSTVMQDLAPLVVGKAPGTQPGPKLVSKNCDSS